MRRFTISFLILISLIVIPWRASAHPGRTDSYGCHTCRTNCASWGLSQGEYHCHNAKQPYQPEEPVTSTYGEGGTGYTTPEPDYKYENNSTNTAPTNTNVSSTPQAQNSPATDSTSNNTDYTGWIVAAVVAGIGFWYIKRKK